MSTVPVSSWSYHAHTQPELVIRAACPLEQRASPLRISNNLEVNLEPRLRYFEMQSPDKEKQHSQDNQVVLSSLPRVKTTTRSP